MEKKRLRVVSYNIHKGFNSGNRKFTLIKIREALRALKPDLVLLQEVLGHHETHRKKIREWPEEPQFEFLAHELWPHFAYGKNAVYSTGHHGNAILSRYPFLFFENIDVSTNRLEKRGLLHGMIELPGRSKPLHALCLHLGLWETERVAQVQKICERIQSHVAPDEPLLLGGDFNDWRGKASLTLEKCLRVREVYRFAHGNHARTFPSWYPTLPLDRIYCRDLAIHGAKRLVQAPWTDLSDHVALLTDLALPE